MAEDANSDKERRTGIPPWRGKLPGEGIPKSKGVPKDEGVLPGEGIPKGEGRLPDEDGVIVKGTAGQVDRGTPGQMDPWADNPWAPGEEFDMDGDWRPPPPPVPLDDEEEDDEFYMNHPNFHGAELGGDTPAIVTNPDGEDEEDG